MYVKETTVDVWQARDVPKKKGPAGVDRDAKQAGQRFGQVIERGAQTELAEEIGCDQGNLSAFASGTKGLGLGAFLRLMRALHAREKNVLFVVLGPAAESGAASVHQRAAARTEKGRRRREQAVQASGGVKADEAARGVAKPKRSRSG
jgi:hypothetical protein